MTANEPTADGDQERTGQIRHKIASIIASHAAPVAEDFYTKALAVEARAYNDELESPEEIAEMLSEAHKEIEALDELAQSLIDRED